MAAIPSDYVSFAVENTICARFLALLDYLSILLFTISFRLIFDVLEVWVMFRDDNVMRGGCLYSE